MRLTSIAAANFKGSNFNYQLGPANAIVGPNMTGKTAIVQAIRLALAGWLPECGKTAKATWELSSGPEMKICAEFDQPAYNLCRTYWLDGATVKTSVSTNSDIDGLEWLTALGSLPLLNAEQYFEMTENERLAYVFSNVTMPKSFTPDSIISECQRLSLDGLHTELVQQAKRELVRDVEIAFEGVSKGLTLNVQDALNEALATFRDRFTYWNKRAKDTQGAVTTLAELKLREKNFVAVGPDQIPAVQAEIDRLNIERGKVEAQRDEIGKSAARKVYLSQQVVQIPSNIIDRDEEIENVEIMVAALQKGLLATISKAELDSLVGQLRHQATQAQDWGGEIVAMERLISGAVEQLSKLEGMTQCPFCKCSGESWKRHLSVQLSDQVKVARSQRDAYTKKLDETKKSLEALRSKIDDAQAAHASNIRDQERIEYLQKEVALARKAKASDEALFAAMQEELKRLRIERPEDCTASLSAINDSLQEQSQLLATLRLSKDAEVGLQRELKRAAEAELEHHNAEAHLEVVRAIAKLLKAKREAMVVIAFESLFVTANRVVNGIMRAGLSSIDNTIGMWQGAKFIPHRVFSGTEKALTYIATAVALSARAPFRLVILDEFGRLDKTRQVAVLERLMGCVRGNVIDQFIVVGTSLPIARPDSLNVIEVREENP